MLKDDTYINIQSWMRTDLDLSGNELIAYAIIYGFSQDGESRFRGSRQYIADWCGVSTRAVQTILNNLVERGLIKKFEDFRNGVKMCEYAVNFTTSEETSPPGEKTSLYNIDNTIEGNRLSKDNLSDEPTQDDVIESDGFEGHSYDSFIGSCKKKSKSRGSSLFSKCSEENLRFTNNAITVNMLDEYLKLRLQMKDKPIYGINQWKGILNKLAELTSDERTMQKIVQQSIERGWATVYPINSSARDIKKVSNEGNTVQAEKVKGDNYSGESF